MPHAALLVSGLAAALLLSHLTGCASVEDRVADRMNSATERYCEADERTRAVARDRVAGMVEPNEIQVICADD